MPNWIVKIWRQNKSFFVFILLSFVFRSAVADWNEVPTGSMNPTIIEGDRILVNKLAYDIRIPFTAISLFKISDPVRGDIVIFDSKVSNKRLVKRIIGLPGDTVELINNELRINAEALVYKEVSSSHASSDKLEYLYDVLHHVRVSKIPSRLANFPPVRIPKDHYLVLGDNRDNSADSRIIGFVSRSEMVGRTRHVVLSMDYNNYYLPRADRFLHLL